MVRAGENFDPKGVAYRRQQSGQQGNKLLNHFTFFGFIEKRDNTL